MTSLRTKTFKTVLSSCKMWLNKRKLPSSSIVSVKDKRVINILGPLFHNGFIHNA